MILTKELLKALEDWERDGAKDGMPGREAPGGTRTDRLLKAIRAARSAGEGKWKARLNISGSWLVERYRKHFTADEYVHFRAPDEATAREYVSALNGADAQLETDR